MRKSTVGGKWVVGGAGVRGLRAFGPGFEPRYHVWPGFKSSRDNGGVRSGWGEVDTRHARRRHARRHTSAAKGQANPNEFSSLWRGVARRRRREAANPVPRGTAARAARPLCAVPRGTEVELSWGAVSSLGLWAVGTGDEWTATAMRQLACKRPPLDFSHTFHRPPGKDRVE